MHNARFILISLCLFIAGCAYQQGQDELFVEDDFSQKGIHIFTSEGLLQKSLIPMKRGEDLDVEIYIGFRRDYDFMFRESPYIATIDKTWTVTKDGHTEPTDMLIGVDLHHPEDFSLRRYIAFAGDIHRSSRPKDRMTDDMIYPIKLHLPLSWASKDKSVTNAFVPISFQIEIYDLHDHRTIIAKKQIQLFFEFK